VLLLRSRPDAWVQIGSNQIAVTIADTDPERELGLSGHKPLKDSEGMLFIFDVPGQYAFWMKDMLFPIDILWIGSDWKVVDITPNLAPETYPEAFAPKANAQYVLEVSSGYAQAHRVTIGQSVSVRK
jgi:uncharacterized membrane protein (UPF0127 family)